MLTRSAPLLPHLPVPNDDNKTLIQIDEEKLVHTLKFILKVVGNAPATVVITPTTWRTYDTVQALANENIYTDLNNSLCAEQIPSRI